MKKAKSYQQVGPNYLSWKRYGKIFTLIFIFLLAIGAILEMHFIIAEYINREYYTSKDSVVCFCLFGAGTGILGLLGIIIASPFWWLGVKYSKNLKVNLNTRQKKVMIGIFLPLSIICLGLEASMPIVIPLVNKHPSPGKYIFGDASGFKHVADLEFKDLTRKVRLCVNKLWFSKYFDISGYTFSLSGASYHHASFDNVYIYFYGPSSYFPYSSYCPLSLYCGSHHYTFGSDINDEEKVPGAWEKVDKRLDGSDIPPNECDFILGKYWTWFNWDGNYWTQFKKMKPNYNIFNNDQNIWIEVAD